jgi:intracellular sulfur oxidation DsrE/DsrF family protein
VTNIKESGFSVVFHLDEIDKTEMAIKNILNLLADDSIDIAHVALVVNGDAIITLAGNSLWESDILRLIQKEVEIYACRNAMQSKGIVESRLIMLIFDRKQVHNSRKPHQRRCGFYLTCATKFGI